MKNTLSRSAGLVLIAFHALTGTTDAHSWIEELTVVAPNGTFVGTPGYPRGNVLRTNPAFSDTALVWLLPPNGGPNAITSEMKICKPSQSIGNQTAGSPALKASPGNMVALRYQENGHVTLPDIVAGKPKNRGTIFIYGTTTPSNDDTLLGVQKWTIDGKGGDGRGVLLATRNYDDGQCYQVNQGQISAERQKEFPHPADSQMGINLWCQSDVTIPSSTKDSGSYTLYWVWEWPTAVGTPGMPQGKNETYTTCMDVQMTPSGSTGSSKAAISFDKGQDLNSAAVPNQLETAFLVSITSTATGSDFTTSSDPVDATTTSAPAPSNAGGENTQGVNGKETVTVTEKVHDTVTITRTLDGTPTRTSIPTASEAVTSTTNTPRTVPTSSSFAPVGEQPDGSLTASPVNSQPLAASSSAEQPNIIGSLTISPFLSATKSSANASPTTPTTLATSAKPSTEDSSVQTTTVEDVITKTFTRQQPLPTGSSQGPKIKGRWAGVKGKWVVTSALP